MSAPISEFPSFISTMIWPGFMHFYLYKHNYTAYSNMYRVQGTGLVKGILMGYGCGVLRTVPGPPKKK